MSALGRKTDDVAVVGGGPAGLMAAEVLSGAGLGVTVYDRMPSVGRKFLIAGRGGLNLTHSEDRAAFLARYASAADRLTRCLDGFPPGALTAWCEGLGVTTFTGTSGRVFPASLKSSPLLRAWLRRLERQGVQFALRHQWVGWSEDGALDFATPAGGISVSARATVLALGGASWPRLGSDGGWKDILSASGVEVTALQPANCGCEIIWSGNFREKFAGAPLKRIIVAVGGVRARGEAIITRGGLEGGPVYALAAPIRDSLSNGARARIEIDLRPDLDLAALAMRLARPRGKQTLANHIRRTVSLSPAAIAILREDVSGPILPKDPEMLARRIKAVVLLVRGVPDIARAISTAGGVALGEIDAHMMLRAQHGVFVAGEMLDWEAPTGGYLLQACFATGYAAAHGVLRHLGRSLQAEPPPPWQIAGGRGAPSSPAPVDDA